MVFEMTARTSFYRRFATQSRLPAFIARARKNEPLIIYGDGKQTRDFVDVQTVAAANIFLATQSAATGVFIVAGGEAITINRLAKTRIDFRRIRD
jgi:UDP-glucose 4-epimerase